MIIPEGALPHIPVRLPGFETAAGSKLDSLRAEENGFAFHFGDSSAVVRVAPNFIDTETNLIENGTFATNDLTGWADISLGTGTVNASTGAARLTGTDTSNRGRLNTSFSTEVGKKYVVTFEVTADAGGIVSLGVGTSSGHVGLLDFATADVGIYEKTFVASAVVSHVNFRTTGATDITIDNISVKRVAPANQNGDVNSVLTYTSPSTKNIFNQLGVLESGTTIRCDHDPATKQTSTTEHVVSINSLGLSKTFTVADGTLYSTGQCVRASDTSASTTNFYLGTVTGTTATTVTIAIEAAEGSGTISAWTVIRALGALIEPAATNILLNSATLSTQSVTVTATAYTLSFYGTGTVTLSGASTSGPLVGAGANNRVTLTFTPSAGSLTLTVSGTVSNAQLETGSVATSPIITTGTAVTRAGDNISELIANLPWSDTAMSIIACYTPKSTTESHRVWQAQNAGETERIAFWQSASVKRYLATSSGATQANASVGADVIGEESIAAISFKQDDMSGSLNGGAVVTDTVATMPSGMTTFYIGRYSGGGVLNGHVLWVKGIPRDLTDAELQSESA